MGYVAVLAAALALALDLAKYATPDRA